MKIVIMFLAIFLGAFFNAISAGFDFTPININFIGVESKKDTIIAYGDFGSLLISADGGSHWSQSKAFERGLIITVSMEDSRITAFSDFGEAAVSTDNGKSWSKAFDFHDSVLAAIRYPEGYFIRLRNRFMILSDKFDVKKQFAFNTIAPMYIFPRDKFRKSLSCFKENLIAEIDSAKYIRFDLNLNPVDTFSYYKSGFSNTFLGYFRIFSDSVYFYSLIGGNIYRTKDFKNIERIYTCSPYNNSYRLLDGKIFILDYYSSCNYKFYRLESVDSAIKVFDSNFDEFIESPIVKDFNITGGNCILAGDSKLILSSSLSDSSKISISRFSINQESIPDKIDDSTFIFYHGGDYGIIYNYLFLTGNKGVTFKENADYKLSPNLDKNVSLGFKYYDEKKHILYLAGSKAAFKSEDYGHIFKYYPLSDFNFNTKWPSQVLSYPISFPNMSKSGNDFILSTHELYPGKILSSIFTYSDEFKLQCRFIDSNKIRCYVNSPDTNNYLTLYKDLKDYKYKITNTTDKGTNWANIKTYKFTDSLMYYKEITAGERTLLFIFYLSTPDSIYSIDVMDIASKEINTIHQYKLTEFAEYSKKSASIDFDGKTYYIPLQDTLFCTENLYDRSKWHHYMLPNGGKIIKSFKKFGDLFYVRYADSLHPDNIYWMKITDTVIVKPEIAANDVDFGKVDIKIKDTTQKTIKIENLSKVTNLVVDKYTGPSDKVFISGFPVIDSLYPLIIEPEKSFEFIVGFKPESAGKYKDSITFHSNALEQNKTIYLTGEGIDTATVISEMEVESEDYFYSFPPFPIPASKFVKIRIYWDPVISIDDDPISVYNIYGIKVSGKENITIDKTNAYSGYLIWDCSLQAEGIYLICITHGSGSGIIKVIVSK